MNAYLETEPETLMQHFFKDKHVHSPRIKQYGDILDSCRCSDKPSAISSYYLNRHRREKLVVYLRVNANAEVDEKFDLIYEFCQANGYQIVDVWSVPLKMDT